MSVRDLQDRLRVAHVAENDQRQRAERAEARVAELEHVEDGVLECQVLIDAGEINQAIDRLMTIYVGGAMARSLERRRATASVGDNQTSGVGEVSRAGASAEASFPTTTPARGPEEAGALRSEPRPGGGARATMPGSRPSEVTVVHEKHCATWRGGACDMSCSRDAFGRPVPRSNEAKREPLPAEWLEKYGANASDEQLAQAWLNGAGAPRGPDDRVAEVSLTALLGWVRKQEQRVDKASTVDRSKVRLAEAIVSNNADMADLIAFVSYVARHPDIGDSLTAAEREKSLQSTAREVLAGRAPCTDYPRLSEAEIDRIARAHIACLSEQDTLDERLAKVRAALRLAANAPRSDFAKATKP